MRFGLQADFIRTKDPKGLLLEITPELIQKTSGESSKSHNSLKVSKDNRRMSEQQSNSRKRRHEEICDDDDADLPNKKASKKLRGASSEKNKSRTSSRKGRSKSRSSKKRSSRRSIYFMGYF